MLHKILGVEVPRNFANSVPVVACSSQGFNCSHPKLMDLKYKALVGTLNLIWWFVHLGFSTAWHKAGNMREIAFFPTGTESCKL